jgi:hypothetical protein
MNERIQQLYQQAHEPQPPTRGTGTLTKDILWEQPNKFNAEKFAELIVRECNKIMAKQYQGPIPQDVRHMMLVLQEHFGVEEK